jgi:hypothetical protein
VKTNFKLNPYWILAMVVILIAVLLASYQLFQYERINSNSNNLSYNKNLEDEDFKNIYNATLSHLENISKEPHPTGSDQIYKVKEYIIKTIKSAGYNPIIQNGSLLFDTGKVFNSDRLIFSYLENIYTIIPSNISLSEGSSINENQKTILVVCHYDSVPTSYGAADDSLAVAASLANFQYISNQVSKGFKLKNSILFLFTDGEELGLLGSKFFTENNFDENKIGAIINLEARGNSGMSILFQSNCNKTDIIRQYSKYDKNVIAYSFANDIYKIMPNNTDYTFFEQTGVDGLNFASIGNSVSYHNEVDSLENLDKGLIIQQSSKIYNFLRAFSNFEFNDNSEYSETFEGAKKEVGPFVYFSIFGRIISLGKVSYILILAFLSCVAVFILIYYLIKKTMRFRDFAFSLLQTALVYILFPLIAYLGQLLLTLLFPSIKVFTSNPYNELYYYLFPVCFGVLGVTSIFVFLFKKMDFKAFLLSNLIFANFVSFLLLKFMRGLSILTIFLGFYLLVLFVIMRVIEIYQAKRKKSKYGKELPFLSILNLIPLTIGIPISYLIYLALGLNYLFISVFGLLCIPIFFISMFEKINSSDKKFTLVIIIILLVVLLILIQSNINFTKKNPMPSSVSVIKNDNDMRVAIEIPVREIKYSNSLWHRSIISLGKQKKLNNSYIIEDLSNIKLSEINMIKINSKAETKKYKQYLLEIKAPIWFIYLPENSFVSIDSKHNFSVDRKRILKGVTPYDSSVKLLIRIPQKDTLSYYLIKYLKLSDLNCGIPAKPDNIMKLNDTYVQKGELK